MAVTQRLAAQRTGSDLYIEGYPPLNLRQTLYCGQSFRWRELPGGTHLGVIDRTPVAVRQCGERVVFPSLPPSADGAVSRYFDLNTDYAALIASWADDKVLCDAVAFAPGLRLLWQDPFEALVCFIISQTNNIKRITSIVTALCAAFGDPVRHPLFPDEPLYTFPTPGRLASCTLEDLSVLRAGYRARYIQDAAQKVASGQLDLTALQKGDPDTARTALMTVQGVGPKVADCAMLYGMHHCASVPMDVWMKRVMTHFYPGGQISVAGEQAGIAQQFLFHYCRSNPNILLR